MRKLISLVVLVGFTILMLMPVQPLQPVQRVQAASGSEVLYTVRYACMVSPDMWGHIEGEWTSGCDGSWTGWGWEPGHLCTYTDVTYYAGCSGPYEPSYP